MRKIRRPASLPIGRTARIAFEIDVMRAECCKAARTYTAQKNVDEAALEECARLDDALAEAQRVLKAAVRGVMLTRISRRSRAS